MIKSRALKISHYIDVSSILTW